MTENPNQTPAPGRAARRKGRPRLDPAEVRGAILGVRLSPAERAEVEAKAAAQGMTPAGWLRQAALSRRMPSPPVPELNRKVYAGLARTAANLNQLTKLANEGRVIAAGDLLEELRAEVVRLRMALLGVSE